MKRRADFYNNMLKWEKETDICPYPFNRLKKRVREAHHCEVEWDGQNSFRVKDRKYMMIQIVNMVQKTCSCGYWQRTGVPCAHLARSCIDKGWKVEDFVRAAYEQPIECTRGSEMWEDYAGPKLEPPVFKRRPGRPKKNRIPSTGEIRKGQGGNKFAYLSRHGRKMRCGHCRVQGHNTRSCPKLKGTSQDAPTPQADFQFADTQFDAADPFHTE